MSTPGERAAIYNLSPLGYCIHCGEHIRNGLCRDCDENYDHGHLPTCSEFSVHQTHKIMVATLAEMFSYLTNCVVDTEARDPLVLDAGGLIITSAGEKTADGKTKVRVTLFNKAPVNIVGRILTIHPMEGRALARATPIDNEQKDYWFMEIPPGKYRIKVMPA